MAVTVIIYSYFCQIKNNRISTYCTGYVLESVIKCFMQEELLSSKSEFLYPVIYRQRPGNIYVIADGCLSRDNQFRFPPQHQYVARRISQLSKTTLIAQRNWLLSSCDTHIAGFLSKTKLTCSFLQSLCFVTWM